MKNAWRAMYYNVSCFPIFHFICSPIVEGKCSSTSQYQLKDINHKLVEYGRDWKAIFASTFQVKLLCMCTPSSLHTCMRVFQQCACQQTHNMCTHTQCPKVTISADPFFSKKQCWTQFRIRWIDMLNKFLCFISIYRTDIIRIKQ